MGIAIGAGTDVAVHSAGITLIRCDPRLIPQSLDISKKTYQKIKQVLFWAFIYNLVGIPLAALGYLLPAIAGGAMALSSVSVVSSALLLKRWKPPLALNETNSIKILYRNENILINKYDRFEFKSSFGGMSIIRVVCLLALSKSHR